MWLYHGVSTSEGSLKRLYFALFDDGTYFHNFEMGVYLFLHSNSSFIIGILVWYFLIVMENEQDQIDNIKLN